MVAPELQWYPIWCDHLPQACEDNQAGFYFEEGGCFGFALAARTALLQSGLDNVELAIKTDFCHAYAKIGHIFIDHQGASVGLNNIRVVNADELLSFAHENGHTADSISHDQQWATNVIERAIERALEAEPWTLLACPSQIATHIESTSPDWVDTEFIEECFAGAQMCLGMALIETIKPGPADSNEACAKKQAAYAAMPLETRPPIVIDQGRAADGNHRLRDAKARRETFILSYIAVDDSADTSALRQKTTPQTQYARETGRL